MALVSMRQLLDHAGEHGYGLPAFNVNNMEQVQAIMSAAADCDSPVILQGSAGARKYAGEPFLRHLVLLGDAAYPGERAVLLLRAVDQVVVRPVGDRHEARPEYRHLAPARIDIAW